MDGDRLAATGISGLDDILRGGLPRNRLYLVEGDPGSGKTTLGLQFLLEGARIGEAGLYVALSETADEIHAVAQSHGWSLAPLQMFEMSAAQQQTALKDENTLFDPSEVELHELMTSLLGEVDSRQAARVVFDSLSELRLLAQEPLRYRRQILTLKQFFSGRKATVLLLDDRTSSGASDMQLQSLAHGVISLENNVAEYGKERRRLRIVKLRGVNPRGGYHEFVIHTGGLQVFPRLVAAEHGADAERSQIASGVPELDVLLGGGIDRGTSTLVLGAAGTGKSSLTTRYLVTAAERGETAALFAFDERTTTLRARSAGLGMPLDPHLKSGRITIHQIDPAEMGPGEFAALVRDVIDRQKVRTVVIDSLNGYLNAMPEFRLLVTQMHELLSYLSQKSVTSFLVLAQRGLVGAQTESPVDLSYLADTVLFMRFFESEGHVRKALSVLKKRSGAHETTIREYQLGPPTGVRLGPALSQFTGVLTGTPRFRGVASQLMSRRAGDVESRT
jgi:circadian clock protein KaiC